MTVKTIGAKDSPVHLNFEHMPAIDAGLPRISEPHLKFRHKNSQYRVESLLAKLDLQISGAGSVITQLKTYANNSPVHLNLNQMAAKAAALPGIMPVGVSYSDTAIQYRHDLLYCQIGLPNLQCAIYLNETHDIWPAFSGAPESR